MARRSRGDGPPAAHLALFEATALNARGVKEQLVSRAFPTASVRLYTSRDDPESNLVAEFGSEAMLVTSPDIDGLGPIDIAFLCGTREEGAQYLGWAERKGFLAIDLSGASRGSDGIPTINVAVNPGAIPMSSGVVAAPHPIAQFLSTLLAPLARSFAPVRATAVVLQPVSECGEGGIEELYQQTIGLLNFREVPDTMFGRQLAFNLLPSPIFAGQQVAGGATPLEVEREVNRMLGPDVQLTIEILMVPVFHCHSAVLHLELHGGPGRERVEAALREAEGIRLPGARESITPAERVGKPGVAVSGIRPTGRDGAHWLWAVTDNLQSGSALNAVRIAEIILARRGTARTH
ncbi:MAG: Asd/ArgC dimerization domain-containing protein [Acidobacteria bacterium]|nr:Asd/ArgC dimerization domain-containing protein [Acidobacteriota bacterium]